MAKYRYRATTEQGKIVIGVLEASSEANLYAKLREQQIFMISCKEERGRTNRSRKITMKALADFSRQLGTFLAAGVSLVRALGILSTEELTKNRYKEVYGKILVSVRQGKPLSDAMEEQGAAFPPLMISMFRSAEASGDLDRVALRMGDHYEKEFRTHSKIKNAMTYPYILLVLTLGVVLILFTYVLPQFQGVLDQMEELPFLTRMVMGISDGIKGYWWLILIVVGVVVLIIQLLLRISSVRYYKDRIKLQLPILGKLLKVVYTARFARTLSSLYSAGLPIVIALQISSATIGNAYIEEQFDKAIARVREGERLSDSLGEIDGFIKKLAASIMVGEETGSLESMLDSIADELDYESEMVIARMLTYLEPIMIVIMAIIVGVVIISVMLPLYGSYNAIGALV